MTTCVLSITILTYNSGEFIDELLESLYLQGNKKVQLVISDDFSTDKTVEKIKNWLMKLDGLFFEIIFLENFKNVGVVENKIRTFSYLKGEWHKGIAGDDKLHNNAMNSLLEDCEKYKNSSIVIGKARIFGNSNNINAIIPRENLIGKLNSIKKIRNYLFEGYTFPAICFLVKTEIYYKNNLFKKARRNFEDIPFQLEALNQNINFTFSDKIYIDYRKHDKNLSQKKTNEILANSFFDYQRILLYYAFVSFKIKYIINSLWNLIMSWLIFRLGNKNKLCEALNNIRKKIQPKRFFNLLFKPF